MGTKLTKDQERALRVLREAGERPMSMSVGQYALIRPATGFALMKKGFVSLGSNRAIRLTDEGAAVAATLVNPSGGWD